MPDGNLKSITIKEYKIMKLKSYIYSFVAGAVMFTACSPDEHNLGEMTYVADDLVQGIAFSVNA